MEYIEILRNKIELFATALRAMSLGTSEYHVVEQMLVKACKEFDKLGPATSVPNNYDDIPF